MKLRIMIPAMKEKYRNAALLAAKTYRLFNPQASIELYTDEVITSEFVNVKVKADDNLAIFLLRCYLDFVRSALKDEVLLMADADTLCMRSLAFENQTVDFIEQGKVGLTLDVAYVGTDRGLYQRNGRDRFHSSNHDDPNNPLFVPEEKRKYYYNSGVIVAGEKSVDIFERYYELSCKIPCNKWFDQDFIVYCANVEFSERTFHIETDARNFSPFNCMNDEDLYVKNAYIFHCIFHRGGIFDNNLLTHNKMSVLIAFKRLEQRNCSKQIFSLSKSRASKA